MLAVLGFAEMAGVLVGLLLAPVLALLAWRKRDRLLHARGWRLRARVVPAPPEGQVEANAGIAVTPKERKGAGSRRSRF